MENTDSVSERWVSGPGNDLIALGWNMPVDWMALESVHESEELIDHRWIDFDGSGGSLPRFMDRGRIGKGHQESGNGTWETP